MAITATTKAQAERTLAPAGTFVARCYKMIHIGTIQDEYNGESRWVNKVLIEWELPTETKVFTQEKGEQPISVSKEFALSVHAKSTLRAFLTSWRGKGFTEDEAINFDVSKLVGVPCQLSIIHEPRKSSPGEFFAKISSVSALMKGFNAPAQVNPSFVFELDAFDQAKFDSLPDWIKAKIMTSKEYQALKSPQVAHMEQVQSKVDAWTQSEQEDDLPF
jgi:hypothetical protein